MLCSEWVPSEWESEKNHNNPHHSSQVISGEGKSWNTSPIFPFINLANAFIQRWSEDMEEYSVVYWRLWGFGCPDGVRLVISPTVYSERNVLESDFLPLYNGTTSQCREMRSRVTWSLLGTLKTRCAAAFWIIYRGLIARWKSSQKSIAIVQPRNGEDLDKKLFWQHDL